MAKEQQILSKEEDGFNIKVLFALDAQWVKIDDIIMWAKKNMENDPSEKFHFVVKEMIKLKNQKPNE